MTETVAARIARELRTTGRDHPHNTLEETVATLLEREIIRPGPLVLTVLCRCGHGEFLHDIRRDGTRSRCYFIAGPRGVQCTCMNFREQA